MSNSSSLEKQKLLWCIAQFSSPTPKRTSSAAILIAQTRPQTNHIKGAGRKGRGLKRSTAKGRGMRRRAGRGEEGNILHVWRGDAAGNIGENGIPQIWCFEWRFPAQRTHSKRFYEIFILYILFGPGIWYFDWKFTVECVRGSILKPLHGGRIFSAEFAFAFENGEMKARPAVFNYIFVSRRFAEKRRDWKYKYNFEFYALQTAMWPFRVYSQVFVLY